MLKIFNTLTKQKERFEHSLNRIINIYVCGVTVYDVCHIGHARTFMIFDMIIRYFQHIGYNTFYVRNITDIDDKIINKSNEQKESIDNLVNRMIQLMKKDFLHLNFISPNYEPRVTECIPDIIEMIDFLLKNNFAYISDNRDVLFSIKSYKNYGLLSGRKIKDCISHYCSECNFSEKQSDDFVLWKHHDSRKNFSYSPWVSPWGFGRPGWHIECSAMINKFFKENIDIHGGGIDLLFPHHENEIAQLKSFQNSFGIGFWVHVGMVVLDNKKMSKSLLNTISIDKILKKYDSEVIRYYFLSTHYRHPLNYTNKNLYTSYNILMKIYNSISHCTINIHIKTDYASELRNLFKNQFYKAMNNDFNTPEACLILQKISQYINKVKKNNIYLADILASDLVVLGNVLGLLNHHPKNFLRQSRIISGYNIQIVENLVKMRNSLRLKKQWHLADILRKKLLEFGVIVEDDGLNISTYRFIK